MYITENLRATLIQRELKVDVLMKGFNYDTLIKLSDEGRAIAHEMMREAKMVKSNNVTLIIMDDVAKVIKNIDVIISSLKLLIEKYEYNMN